MGRWVVDLVAGVLLAVAAAFSILALVGWPVLWGGASTLNNILLATVFIPYLVRAWAGRDRYDDPAGRPFIFLAVNLIVVGAVVWATVTLPREVLLAMMVLAIQAVFTYQAWRRARASRNPEAPAS